MGSIDQSVEYLLGRSLNESVRLNAQHLLWTMHNGYCLHPQIPVRDDMKIAEIGTGTAIWLFDLVKQLPPTVQLHGFDISDQQFPAPTLCPSNVKLDILDSFSEPPEALVGQYDVVHLRMWACVVRGNDPTALIRHARSLLKPGGYIQWDDGTPSKFAAHGVAAERFEKTVKDAWKAIGIQHGWLSDLPHHLHEHGLHVLELKAENFGPELVNLCTNTFLGVLLGMLQGIKSRPEGRVLPSMEECADALQALYAETKQGAYLNWAPLRVLAQKEDDGHHGAE